MPHRPFIRDTDWTLWEQIIDTNLGRVVLERLLNDVKDKAIIEFRPRMEGNTLHAILAPVKKEPAKKAKPPAQAAGQQQAGQAQPS